MSAFLSEDLSLKLRVKFDAKPGNLTGRNGARNDGMKGLESFSALHLNHSGTPFRYHSHRDTS